MDALLTNFRKGFSSEVTGSVLERCTVEQFAMQLKTSHFKDHMDVAWIGLLIIVYALLPKEPNPILPHGIVRGYRRVRLSFVLTANEAVQEYSFNILKDDQNEGARQPHSCTPVMKTVIYPQSVLIIYGAHKKVYA